MLATYTSNMASRWPKTVSHGSNMAIYTVMMFKLWLWFAFNQSCSQQCSHVIWCIYGILFLPAQHKGSHWTTTATHVPSSCLAFSPGGVAVWSPSWIKRTTRKGHTWNFACAKGRWKAPHCEPWKLERSFNPMASSQRPIPCIDAGTLKISGGHQGPNIPSFLKIHCCNCRNYKLSLSWNTMCCMPRFCYSIRAPCCKKRMQDDIIIILCHNGSPTNLQDLPKAFPNPHFQAVFPNQKRPSLAQPGYGFAETASRAADTQLGADVVTITMSDLAEAEALVARARQLQSWELLEESPWDGVEDWEFLCACLRAVFFNVFLRWIRWFLMKWPIM